MTLPAHICRVFSCDADLDRAQLSALLDQRGADDALPWFLSDKAAQDALVEAQFGGDEPTQFSAVEVFDGTESARYLEVVGVNGVLHQLLTVPEDGQADDAFPTAGLVSLAKVWPTQPDLFIEPDLSQLAEKYRNRLLVFTVGSAEKWDRQNLFQSLAALHGCKIHVGKNATSDPHWIAFGRIDIAAGSILSESALMAGRLLQEILFEGRIRWRYLALYRVVNPPYPSPVFSGNSRCCHRRLNASGGR